MGGKLIRKPYLRAVAILFILGGCTFPTRVEVAPPSSALRAQIVSVGLDVTGSASPAEVGAPIKGKGRGALAGARLGAVCSLTGGAMTADPWGFALGVALMPVFAAGGAIYGAVAARPEEEVIAAQASLKAVKDTDFAMLLRDRVLSRTGAMPNLTIAPVEVPGRKIFDHRLEIEIEGPCFVSDGQFNPDVTLFVGARGGLHRVSDNVRLYERRWVYRGFERRYFQLAADDAALLRSELQAAAERLADKILFDLFVVMEPEVAHTPEPGQAATRPYSGQASGRPSNGCL